MPRLSILRSTYATPDYSMPRLPGLPSAKATQTTQCRDHPDNTVPMLPRLLNAEATLATQCQSHQVYPLPRPPRLPSARATRLYHSQRKIIFMKYSTADRLVCFTVRNLIFKPLPNITTLFLKHFVINTSFENT